MIYEEFYECCKRADAEMKKTNGHEFFHTLKVRCQHCRRSPKQVEGKKCGGWFQTFLHCLAREICKP